MPFKLGPTELIIILVIILMVFGAGKLPRVGTSLGKAVRSFRRGQSGEGEGLASVGTERADGVGAHVLPKKQ